MGGGGLTAMARIAVLPVCLIRRPLLFALTQIGLDIGLVETAGFIAAGDVGGGEVMLGQ